MERRQIPVDAAAFPEQFRPLLRGCNVYDSSCSSQAKVWYLDREGGLYLKQAPGGSLRREAELTAFLHGKGLAARVLAYEASESDWLLTRAVPGEDCTCKAYLDDPKRLSSLLGEALRLLHSQSTEGCPGADHTNRYLAAAEEGWQLGRYDPGWLAEPLTRQEARERVLQLGPRLKSEVLVHGDYCLPNVMLENWRFSGFIDLGQGGIGDRHIDLYWGCWSLKYNLGTDRWSDRFLDAYGREMIDREVLAAVGAFEAFG